MQPMTPEQTLAAAIQHQRAGRLAEAETLYRRILAQHPDRPDALHLLGVLCAQLGRNQEAARLIRHAISLRPDIAGYYANLGRVLFDDQRFEEAVDAYRNATRLNPIDADLQKDLGISLKSIGRLDDALACARHALRLNPNSASAEYLVGSILQAQGQRSSAVAAYQRASELEPNSSLAQMDVANALRAMSCLPQAIAAIRRALQIEPELFDAHLNLAAILLETGQIDDAMQSALQCVQLNPQLSLAHNLLASVYKDDGQVDKAIEQYDLALEIDPDNPAIHSNKVYLLEFDPRSSLMANFAEARLWNQRHAEPLKKLIRPHENDRSPDRPLRIGYVSPHFSAHAISFFLVSLMENHDRTQFEICCYSDGARTDGVTHRIRACASAWQISAGWTDEQLADQIRRDRIDILVDLSMHMTNNRLLALAEKPAPVQVAWIAYPGGTGLDAMDYRISDSWLDPPGPDESLYSEKTIRLPQTWLCYNPLSEIDSAPPRAKGPISFGSLNNPCKLNAPLLKLWAGTMRAVPDSRLLLQAFSIAHHRRLTDFFSSEGISADRIEFLPRCLRSKYLRLYDRIDICLDPLPHNGITTTCDALWMGIPVVTLPGQTAAGRGAASILQNVGLPDFIARDPQDFIRIVSTLAANAARLADLRQSLRDRITRSPMMDAPRFAHAMESAYRQVWQNWTRHAQ